MQDERRRIIEVIRTTPYMRPGQVAEELQMNRKTVLERRKELEKETERYGLTAVIEDEKTILINLYAFLDFMKYRKRLADKNMRKYVPEYDPNVWADACAYGKRVTVLQE